MIALSDYDPSSLAKQFADWDHPQSHAHRLLKAYYNRAGRIDWPAMAIGKSLQSKIEAQIPLRQARISHRLTSPDGTVKLLLQFTRGGLTESVFMPAHRPDRAAGCVSSQIGCAMGCDFCASTREGLERNLEAGEIVEQFLYLKHEALQAKRRLSTLVFMGMGEPLLNLQNVIPAIERIAAPGQGELGAKQITVSTVGIVPGIDTLADSGLNVHLALSLHAPDDKTRARLIPMNRRYDVAQIIEAAKCFQARTRQITNVEYCMLKDINDSADQAHLLVELMKDFKAHINLIPYNPIGTSISGTLYEPPTPDRIHEFLNILRTARIVTHIREPRGQQVDAACGQLRRHNSQLPS